MTGPEILRAELCAFRATIPSDGGSVKSRASCGKSVAKFAGCSEGLSSAKDLRYCIEPAVI